MGAGSKCVGRGCSKASKSLQPESAMFGRRCCEMGVAAFQLFHEIMSQSCLPVHAKMSKSAKNAFFFCYRWRGKSSSIEMSR